jgi:hypothetical protein
LADGVPSVHLKGHGTSVVGPPSCKQVVGIRLPSKEKTGCWSVPAVSLFVFLWKLFQQECNIDAIGSWWWGLLRIVIETHVSKLHWWPVTWTIATTTLKVLDWKQGGRETKFLVPVLSLGQCPRWQMQCKIT